MKTKLTRSDILRIQDSAASKLASMTLPCYLHGNQLTPEETRLFAIIDSAIGVLNSKGLMVKLPEIEFGRKSTESLED